MGKITNFPAIVDGLLSILILASVVIGIRTALKNSKNSVSPLSVAIALALVTLGTLFTIGMYEHYYETIEGFGKEFFSQLRLAVPPLATLLAGYCIAAKNSDALPSPLISNEMMRRLDGLWRIFIVALPVWLFLLSCALLYWGFHQNASIPIEADRQKLLYTIASAALSGGVFAAILKAMQFMNIFQEALEKIIFFDKTWLKNLSDKKLRSIWHDSVAITVAKGFPQLSERLGNDVFEHLIPKLGEYYYSKMFRRIELVSFDPNSGILVINEQYELIINAHSKNTIVPYDFNLNGAWPNELEHRPYEITSFFINNEDYREQAVYVGGRGEDDITVSYKIQLSNKEQYSVRRNMRRATKVASDPILHMIATRFTESMVVSVDNRVSDYIRVRSVPIGITKSGIDISQQEPHLVRCEVTQLMFPGDGLLLVFERV